MKKSNEEAKPPQHGKIVKKPKILGPVKSLEEHLHPDWWRYVFNNLYLKTDADVIDDRNITSKEIDLFLEILQISQEDAILDLCCGQGRHSLELARRGFKNVEGLDRSNYLIHKARTQAKKEMLNVKFGEGDARKLPYPPDTFDVVMILGNSFGYFEAPQDDVKVLKEAMKVLKPWGKILIDIADGVYLSKNFQPRSWEWINKNLFVCRERSLSTDKTRLISREVITDVRKGVIADQFYGERLYNKESLMNLLKSVGFYEVRYHGTISPDSQRNQDLGMMDKRIIITGIAKKEWSPIRKKPQQLEKTIAVILGDIRKPDLIKPSHIFDDDDFYTIDQLKDALRELKEYKFIFLDNHETLISDLMKIRNKINLAFNLCDEGFNNEAQKESYIPTLLEMLNIPYTGATPQCIVHCYDKSLVRGIAKEMGIPVPTAFFIKPEDNIFNLLFDFPVIVKPNFGDSSFGITQKSVVYNHENLMNVISEVREKFGYDKPILVEEFLTGNDLSVGIIGNLPDSYKILPIIEEDYSSLPKDLPKICGYEAKWMPDSPYWKIKSIPANISKQTGEMIVDWCLKLFERLDCRDYVRFDWRLDENGNPKLLEVNPNPGWCWDGHLNKMAKLANWSYAELLENIIKSAERRYNI